MPLFDARRELSGVMVTLFPLDWVRQTLTEVESHSSYEGLGESGEISLIQWRRGEEGTAIHFINTLRRDELREPTVTCQRLRTESPERFAMLDVLKKQSGDGWSLNPSCTEVYTVWRWIPVLQWGMTMNQHKKELLAPTVELRETMLLLVLLYLPLFILLIRRQLQRVREPIFSLAEAAQEGRVLGYSETVVNEVNTLAAALQQNEKRLRAANQAKDEFLASMSHELRTPLTAILGNCDVLADELRDPQQRQQLQAIRSAGDGWD